MKGPSPFVYQAGLDRARLPRRRGCHAACETPALLVYDLSTRQIASAGETEQKDF